GDQLVICEGMVGDQVGAGRAEGTIYDRETMRNHDIVGLVLGRAGRGVSQFIDTVLMIVRREEDHIVNVVIGNEFQQRVAFSSISPYPRFASITGHRSIAHITSISDATERASDGAELINRI